jgi:hypothetical protein
MRDLPAVPVARRLTRDPITMAFPTPLHSDGIDRHGLQVGVQEQERGAGRGRERLHAVSGIPKAKLLIGRSGDEKCGGSRVDGRVKGEARREAIRKGADPIGVEVLAGPQLDLFEGISRTEPPHSHVPTLVASDQGTANHSESIDTGGVAICELQEPQRKIP